MLIDKSTWIPIRLADVTVKKEENDKTNASVRFDKFLKVEHLDAENLNIKRWGNIGVDVLPPTFYKIFRKGQILYPTRNPHLKRCALASFDGICGEKTLTLEPIREVIDERFYPFLFLAHSFFQHTTKSIIGSTNPHVRWRDVAEYKFLLPPKSQQNKLAELLWAANDCIEKASVFKNKFSLFFERYSNDYIDGKFSNNYNDWNKYSLGNLGNTFSGLTGKSKDDFGKGSPFITYMNVYSNSKIDINKTELVAIGRKENQNEVKYGDIFFTGSSETPQEVGMSSVLLDEVKGLYLNSFCFGFRLNDFNTLNPEYAKYLFRSNSVREFMHRHAQGSTRFNLSKTTVKNKLTLKLPSTDDQVIIAKAIEQKEKLGLQLQYQIEKLEQIQKLLVNQIFSS